MIKIRSKLIEESDFISEKGTFDYRLKMFRGNYILNFKELKGIELPLFNYNEYFLNQTETFITSKDKTNIVYAESYTEIIKKIFYEGVSDLTLLITKGGYIDDEITSNKTEFFETKNFEIYIEDDEFVINFIVKNQLTENI